MPKFSPLSRTVAIVFLALVLPLICSAESGSDALQRIYASRPDLRQFFGADGKAVASPKIKGLPTLEDWARQYGYREYPQDLAAYAPPKTPALPEALAPVIGVPAPIKKKNAVFNWKTVTVKSVYVIDSASHKVLLSKNAQAVRPIASLTKLMTAMIAVDKNVDFSAMDHITAGDEIKNEPRAARLRMADGIPLSIKDIFYAALVGSANNAANALARCTDMTKEDFVAEMNARAAAAGLSSTRFADPTGIDPGNVSTAEEVTALAVQAFSRYEIRKAASTAHYDIVTASGEEHKLTNPNRLLTAANGITVLGGKTGYLDDCGWNLVVEAMDARRHPIVVAVMGAGTSTRSFNDAARIARWVWQNYAWK